MNLEVPADLSKPIDDDEKLTLAETDKPLAETLNPAFRYALFRRLPRAASQPFNPVWTSILSARYATKA